MREVLEKNEKIFSFLFVLCSLNRNFCSLRSQKLLSLDNKNEKFFLFSFCIVLA